jgi:mercuric ion transport protein
VAQVFLAGLSVFDNPARWADHVTIGRQIGGLTILLVLFALLGRMSRLVIGLSVLVFFLYGMQFTLALADVGWLSALHAVNALVLFWLSVDIGLRARSRGLARSRPRMA